MASDTAIDTAWRKRGMSGYQSASLRKLLVSCVILGVLSLQAIAVLDPFLKFFRESGYLWPFLNYPMYALPHYEGDAIQQFVLTGTLSDGSEVPLSSEDFDLSFWQFLTQELPAVMGKNKAELRVYISEYLKRHPRKLVALRLEDHPLLLGRDGAHPGSAQLISIVSVSDLAEAK